MAPKVESGRPAVITAIGALEPALRGGAGTTIRP
jgi:hypothetical protein